MQKLIKHSALICVILFITCIYIYGLYLECCFKIMNCIFKPLHTRLFQAMLFLSLLLVAAPNFRVVAYPNTEYIGGPNVHYNQISSHNLLKPRDPQDTLLPQNVPTIDLDVPEQSPSLINEDSSTGWVSPGQVPGTDYTDQDNSDIVIPDLQAEACAPGPTTTNGKLRRGLFCSIRTPIKSKPKAPSMPKPPEEKPGIREDIRLPQTPPTPPKPLPLLIDKETGQIELDLGPEFAPPATNDIKGPCALKQFLCCLGQLPYPFGNVENCWRCMSWALRKGPV